MKVIQGTVTCSVCQNHCWHDHISNTFCR